MILTISKKIAEKFTNLETTLNLNLKIMHKYSASESKEKLIETKIIEETMKKEVDSSKTDSNEE